MIRNSLRGINSGLVTPLPLPIFTGLRKNLACNPSRCFEAIKNKRYNNMQNLSNDTSHTKRNAIQKNHGNRKNLFHLKSFKKNIIPLYGTIPS